MPEIKTEESWIPWSVKQPENPGMYWWRLQSAVLPELTLIFAASLKTCNGVKVPPFIIGMNGRPLYRLVNGSRHRKFL